MCEGVKVTVVHFGQMGGQDGLPVGVVYERHPLSAGRVRGHNGLPAVQGHHQVHHGEGVGGMLRVPFPI